MSQGSDYLEATREVIEENRGLWFLNESFSFTRRSAGGAVS
jgi:hypothetical protein